MEITLESVFMLVITIGLSVIGYFLSSTHKDFKERFAKMEGRMDKQEKDLVKVKSEHSDDMHSLKLNYIARFEQVNNSINLLRTDIMEGINALDRTIQSQAQFCKLVQESKREHN